MSEVIVDFLMDSIRAQAKAISELNEEKTEHVRLFLVDLEEIMTWVNAHTDLATLLNEIFNKWDNIWSELK